MLVPKTEPAPLAETKQHTLDYAVEGSVLICIVCRTAVDGPWSAARSEFQSEAVCVPSPWLTKFYLNVRSFFF